MSINIGLIQKASSPNPFALLSTLKEDGTTNLMAISWWTFVSNNPPLIAAALSNKGHSGSRIKATGEFSLNLVKEDIADAAFKCGTVSGNSIDKASEFGIELTDAEDIKAKLVKASHISLECKLVSTADASDHTIYIAEIINSHIDDDSDHLYAFNGYSKLETIK